MTWPSALSARFRSITQSQLRLNIAASIATNLAGAIITVFSYRFYLQYLGYERYGVWLILSTILVIVQLGNFGISPALQKLVAEDFAIGNIDGVYRYIASGLAGLAVGGVFLFCALTFGRRYIVELFGLSGQSAQTVYTLLPYVAALSVYVIIVDALNAAIAGLGRYDLVNYTQTASQLITLCVTVVGLRLRWDLWSFIIGTLVAYVFLNISSVILIHRLTPSGSASNLRVDKLRLFRLVQFGSFVFGSAVIALVLNPINRVLIARYIGVSSIPVYDIAYMAAMKIRGFIETGFRPLLPALSNLRASEPEVIYERLVSVERTGSRVIFYWGTAFYLLVFVTAGWTLRIWLGARFSPALPPAFRIMLAGTYFSLWGVQAYYTLLGLGRSVHIMNCFVIALAMDLGSILLSAVAPWGGGLSLEAVVASVSLGMLGSTLYLRFYSARLRERLRDTLRV